MNKLTVPPTCYHLCTTLLLVAGPLACSRETNEGREHVASAVSQREAAPAASLRAVSIDSRRESVADNNDLRVTLGDGKLRIFFVAGDEESALIRVQNNSRQTLSEKEHADIRASESEMVQRWLKCKIRFETKPPSTPLEEHDALLEVADRLEPLHKEDPSQLGILRDLLTVYAQLLAFEQESDLGSNLCVLASDKLVDFERSAAPLDTTDQQLVDRIRAWLHFVMHHYPTVALSGNATARKALRILDQQYFETHQSFQIGRLNADVFTTLGKSPDVDLLWDVVHVLVGNPGDKNPAHSVAYTLCAQGPPERQRWYLMGHALNRTSLIRIFGSRRPEFNEVKALVTQHARSMQPYAKQSKEASKGRRR